MQKKRLLALLLVVVTIFAMMVPFSVSAAIPTNKPANATYDRDTALSAINSTTYPASTYPWALYTSTDGANLTYVGVYTSLDQPDDASASTKTFENSLYYYINNDTATTGVSYYIIQRANYKGQYQNGYYLTPGKDIELYYDLGGFEWQYRPYANSQITLWSSQAYNYTYHVYGGKIYDFDQVVNIGGNVTGCNFNFYSTTLVGYKKDSAVIKNNSRTANVNISFTNCTIDLTAGTETDATTNRILYQGRSGGADTVTIKEGLTLKVPDINTAKAVADCVVDATLVGETLITYEANGVKYDYQKTEIDEAEVNPLDYDREDMLASVPSDVTVGTYVVFDADKDYYGTCTNFNGLWPLVNELYALHPTDTAYVFLTKNVDSYGGTGVSVSTALQNVNNCTVIFDATGYKHRNSDSMSNNFAWNHANGTTRNTYFVGGTWDILTTLVSAGSGSGTGVHNIEFIGTTFNVNGGTEIVKNNKTGFAGEQNVTFTDCTLKGSYSSSFALTNSVSTDASKIGVTINGLQVDVADIATTPTLVPTTATLVSGGNKVTYHDTTTDTYYESDKTTVILPDGYDYDTTLNNYITDHLYETAVYTPEAYPFALLKKENSATEYTFVGYYDKYWSANNDLTGVITSLGNASTRDNYTYYIVLRTDYAMSSDKDVNYGNACRINCNVVLDLNQKTFTVADGQAIVKYDIRAYLDLDMTVKNGTVVLDGKTAFMKSYADSTAGGWNGTSPAMDVVVDDVDFVINGSASLVTFGGWRADSPIITQSCIFTTDLKFINNCTVTANADKTLLHFGTTNEHFPINIDVSGLKIVETEHNVILTNGQFEKYATFTGIEGAVAATGTANKIALNLWSEIAPKFIVSGANGVIYNGRYYAGTESTEFPGCYEVQLPKMSADKLIGLTITVADSGNTYYGYFLTAGETKTIDMENYLSTKCDTLGQSILAYAEALGADVTVDYTCGIQTPSYESETVVAEGTVEAITFAASTTTGFTLNTTYVAGTDYTDYVLKVTCGTEHMWIPVAADDGSFTVNAISAEKLAEEFTFQVFNAENGTAVSAVYTYSFVEYAASGASDANVFTAMVNYGLEAKNYNA